METINKKWDSRSVKRIKEKIQGSKNFQRPCQIKKRIPPW